MANRNITLKRNNGGTIDILHPTTVPEQVTGLLSSGKIAPGLLPDSVFGGMKFVGTVNALQGYLDQLVDDDTATEISQTLDELSGLTYPGNYASNDTWKQYLGHYWVITGASDVSGQVAGDYDAAAYDDGVSPDSGQEAGDWIIITGWDDTLNSNAGGFLFSIINNTYDDATTSTKGVVKLATNAEAITGSDATRVITPAALQAKLDDEAYITVDTNTYVNGASFNTNDGVLTLTRTGDITTPVTVDLDGRFLTSQNQDFDTVTVTGTDSGHTWADTGSAIADAVGDTVTFVEGAAIELKVSEDTDAVRIAHGDTSALTGQQSAGAGKYLSSVTIDGFGHITAVGATDLPSDYSLPLATSSVRGGLKIGYDNTGNEETQRPLLLASEKGYITLPRQIPAVTLNGASSTSPSFYAPTTVGTNGQILQSDGSGAPNWIDYEAIKYATASTSYASGTIFIELDT